MDDRQPTYPGRVKIVRVEGEDDLYDVTMADEPTNEGDAPIKKNLLHDSTAEMLGLTKKAVVNDAFVVVANTLKLITSGSAVLNLTVVDNSGLPVKNVMISGLFDAAGGQMYTNDSGKANGIIAANGTTISISGYIDLQDYSEEINITQGGSETKTITLTRVNQKVISTSSGLRFSNNVKTFDVCLCGAGGGSEPAWVPNYPSTTLYRGGSGGGGGYVINLYDLNPQDGDYYITIGVGGKGGNRNTGLNPTSGGYSQITLNGESIGIAMGGLGPGSGTIDGKVGEGNGKGGTGFYHSGASNTPGQNGVSGTVRVFDDPDGDLPGGGGAGGFKYNYPTGGGNPYSGGANYGGDSGQNGTTPGGGAGGQSALGESWWLGFNGGNGQAWVRMVIE